MSDVQKNCSIQVTNVMAISLDGKIARHHHESDLERREFGFTSTADRDHLISILEEADAVITGANSLKVIGKVWPIKNKKGIFPVWAIFTKKGLPYSLPFWEQKEVTRILVSPEPLSYPYIDVSNIVYTHSESPAKKILDEFKKRNFKKVILFGGGDINRLFYAENLVDFIKITVCPFIFGSNDAVTLVNPPLPNFIQLTLTSSITLQDHVFLEYKVKKL